MNIVVVDYVEKCKKVAVDQQKIHYFHIGCDNVLKIYDYSGNELVLDSMLT